MIRGARERIATVLLFVAIAGAFGCSKRDPAKPVVSDSISGLVTTRTGPLEGALVTLRGPTGLVSVTQTNASGQYAFTGLSVVGYYSIEVEHAVHSFVPAGRLVHTDVGSITNADFSGTPAQGLHGLAGTVSGDASAGVYMTLSGDNTGELTAIAGGAYRFRSLLVGNYTITPSRPGYTFTPPSRTVTGTIAFDHPASGALGNASLVSVIWNGQSVVPYFQVTDPAIEGQGTIRARRRSEIAAPDLAGYDAMWAGGGTVVVTYTSVQGNETIELHLGPNPTLSTSAGHFIMIETLSDSTALDFTATAL